MRLLFCTLIGSAILVPFYFFYVPNVLFPVFDKIKTRWLLMLAGAFFRTTWELVLLTTVTLYVTTLVSIYKSAKGKKWVSPLAAFGQMSLSNYLIQSFVLVPFLLAFNKYDNMPPFNGFVLFICLLPLQLVFSNWWMTRYSLGPFEWLLRSFTYWKWQKIRRSEPLPQQVKIFSI